MRMGVLYFEGWETSPRRIIQIIGAFAMSFMMTLTALLDYILGRDLSLLFPFVFSAFIITVTYFQMRKNYGDVWTMSSKEWREPIKGAADTIGDVLMGEGIPYSRTGPITLKGRPNYSIDEVFEMDGLRLMVGEGEITRAFLGPIPLFGSERAKEIIRLVNKALE